MIIKAPPFYYKTIDYAIALPFESIYTTYNDPSG